MNLTPEEADMLRSAVSAWVAMGMCYGCAVALVSATKGFTRDQVNIAWTEREKV